MNPSSVICFGSAVLPRNQVLAAIFPFPLEQEDRQKITRRFSALYSERFHPKGVSRSTVTNGEVLDVVKTLVRQACKDCRINLLPHFEVTNVVYGCH